MDENDLTRSASGRLQRSGKSIGVAIGVGVIAIGGLVAVAGSSAQAVGTTTCYANHQKRAIDWQPDEHRVAAMCKQFASYKEARGYVNMNVCCDKETVWFHDTYEYHYSAWAQGSYSNVGYTVRSR